MSERASRLDGRVALVTGASRVSGAAWLSGRAREGRLDVYQSSRGRALVVSFWPPPTRTEGMLAAVGAETNTAAWLSPEFTGRVIAALAADPATSERSGQTLRVRELAQELGVVDDATL